MKLFHSMMADFYDLSMAIKTVNSFPTTTLRRCEAEFSSQKKQKGSNPSALVKYFDSRLPASNALVLGNLDFDSVAVTRDVSAGSATALDCTRYLLLQGRDADLLCAAVTQSEVAGLIMDVLRPPLGWRISSEVHNRLVAPSEEGSRGVGQVAVS